MYIVEFTSLLFTTFPLSISQQFCLLSLHRSATSDAIKQTIYHGQSQCTGVAVGRYFRTTVVRPGETVIGRRLSENGLSNA